MWFSEKWIDLESIIFSEISQIMTTCHVFSHVNLEGKKEQHGSRRRTIREEGEKGDNEV
jgi:hypothetical protein